MLADAGNNGPRPDPLVGGGHRVVIVDGTIGGIFPSQGFPHCLVSSTIRSQPELAIMDCCKGPGLKDYIVDGVREIPVVNPIEDDGGDGHLTLKGFAPSFAVNSPGQKVDFFIADRKGLRLANLWYVQSLSSQDQLAVYAVYFLNFSDRNIKIFGNIPESISLLNQVFLGIDRCPCYQEQA